MATTALPLQQHPNFGAALKLLGRDIQHISVEGAAPSQMISRLGLRFIARGPIWNSAPDPSALRGCSANVVNSEGGDETALRQSGFRRIITGVSVAELSLIGTAEDRLRRQRKKWRNTFRHAKSAGHMIRNENFNSHRHRWLLREDILQQRKKGFRSLPHCVIEAYAQANATQSQVWTAYHCSEPIAAMLFLIHGPVATYHLGWTGPEGRKRAAHHAILMTAADDLSARGVERLDLGTVDTESAPGLARFKIGSGATVRQLGGTWLRLPWL